MNTSVIPFASRKISTLVDDSTSNDSPIRKDIPGYEGLYQADDQGNIWSIGCIGWRGTKKLIPYVQNNGYLKVLLYNNGKRYVASAHRVILTAFKGAPPTSKHHCCHNNGIKTDNRPENLRWGTAKENKADSIKAGTCFRPLGEKNPLHKLTAKDVLEIIKITGTHKYIAERYRVSPALIGLVKNGKAWNHVTGIKQ